MRLNTPKPSIIYYCGKRLISSDDAIRFAEVIVERMEMQQDDLGTLTRDRAALFVQEKLGPTMFGYLIEIGEIDLPPDGEKFHDDGPEVLKMRLVAAAVAAILGFNKAANEKFGKGKWSL